VTTVTDDLLAWEVALDRLELDLVVAERLVRSGEAPVVEPWDVPAVDGPLPATLLPRALELQARQAVVEAALRDALSATSKQRALADRVNAPATGLVSSAYVDFTA
jgi:hypothetical protein